MRHTAEELGAGETAILTLADKGVLDEDDADELENVLAVRARACLPCCHRPLRPALHESWLGKEDLRRCCAS